MKMLKRSLAMFLALCMIVSMVPMATFAEEIDGTVPAVTESIDATTAPAEATEAHGETTAATTTPVIETEGETEGATEAETEGATEAATEPSEVETEPTEVETEPTEVETEPTEEATEPKEELEPVVFDLRASAFLKVFHLDCGRKYFTVDQIKELIDAIANVGFSHMELAIGNDGLRLLLDDMSVLGYDSDTIKNGIKAGNAAYSHAGEWTEAEMDEIIAYANRHGIEIIPLINTPGHMDAILAAMKACGINGYYKGSSRTVDLENAAAVEFTQALVMKYATYFANKGCQYFNMGADEYANDHHTSASTGKGFGYLIDNNKYGYFIDYVNTMVKKIMDKGMTAIAFNDGIYFRENTSFGTFNTNLMVAAWTGGWGGIKPASTTFLANKGHQLLNTNERWYYVLGRAQAVNSTYCYESALSNAKSESVTTVTDRKGSTPIGAMQCVWCDVPSVSYETYKSNVMTLINTLAANNTTYFTGPNEVEPEVPETEPTEPSEPEEPETVTKTDEATGVAASAPGLTGLTVAKIEDETRIPAIEGALGIQAYDVSAFVSEQNYTGAIEISVPVPSNWAYVHGGVLASESGEEVLGISGKLENGVFTFTAPHLSDVVAYATDYDRLVEVEIGETSATITDNSGYYTTVADLDESVATVVLGGSAGTEATVKYTSTSVSYRSLATESSWTKTDYYYNVDGQYYPVYAYYYKRGIMSSTRYYYGYSKTDSTTDVTQIDSSTSGNTNVSLYTKSGTEAVPAKTTVSFTGVSAGETYAKIGNTTYKVVVSKKNESAMVTVGDVKTFADSSTSAPVVADPDVVDAKIENGTLTVTTKTVGTTTVTTDYGVYTITVVAFDPDSVADVTVNLWITSHYIEAEGATISDGKSTMYIDVLDSGVYSENGAKLTDLIPFTGKDPQNDTNADTIHNLWQVRLQHEGAQQTNEGSDDKTAVGEKVEYIRFFGNKWQVQETDGTWIDIASSDVLSAYYLMKSPLTTEVDSLVKDWGFQFKDGQKYWQYFDESSYSALSAQVIYEGNTMNPGNDAGLINTTVFFNFWKKGQDNHAANRDIGFFMPQFNADYEVYKITTMHGTCSVSARNDNASSASVDYGNPAPNHADEVTVWEIGDGTPEIVGKDGDDALQWRESGDAILIRIYIRAKKTEDALTVVYYDEKFGDTLYTYNIAVKVGDNFNNGITPAPSQFAGNAERIDVTGCIIKNKSNVDEKLETNLANVTEAVGKYKNDLYTYTGSVISDDGKTLYLYYTINTSALSPMYVVDFGLPISFSIDALRGSVTTDVKSVTVKEDTRYGKLTYNENTQMFTYKPTTILNGVDVLSIGILFDGEDYVTTTNVGVTPATTVYYGEKFLNFSGSWSTAGSAVDVGTQKTEVLGESTYYGYDPAYANKNGAGASDGTAKMSKTIGDTATFTFTGTGIQVFANSASGFGYASVMVKNKDTGAIAKMVMVDTDLGGTAGTDTTAGQIGKNLSGLPIVSLVDLTGLPHATYEVTITKIMDSDPVYIDGIRVFETIDESKTLDDNNHSIFFDDEEDNPDFYEVRDVVLKAMNIQASESVDYKTMYSQVYNNTVAVGATAVITNEDAEKIYGTMNRQDLLDNGPKNELYLFKGDTLTMNISTSRVVQLGLKAPEGTATYKLNGGSETTLKTSVDMFYKVQEKGGNIGTITVENTGDKILSVTLLKVCDDPNFAFAPLTEKNVKAILADAGIFEEVVEPETPVVPETPTEPDPEPTEPEPPKVVYADAVVTVKLVDYKGKVLATTKLTDNGVEGEKAVFSGKDIQSAAKAKLPKGYDFVNKSAASVKTTYGESKEVKIQIGKVATLKIAYVNLLGRKQGSKTITMVQKSAGNWVVSASTIRSMAPAGRRAVWLLSATVPYGKTVSIVVPVY